MAGHSDVSKVAIHGAGGEDVGLINRCALGLMDRDGATVVEAAEVIWVDLNFVTPRMQAKLKIIASCSERHRSWLKCLFASVIV